MSVAKGLGVKRVVAAGGDGTVSRAARIAIALDVPLAIVPAGTSNSVARALGIPKSLDRACEVALEGWLRRIDTAHVSGPRIAAPTRLVLLAAVGLHADAIAGAARGRKASLGRLAYLAEGILAGVRATPFVVRMRVDDAEAPPVQALSVVVASFAPRDTLLAQGRLAPDDGFLEITVIEPPRVRAVALAALSVARSRAAAKMRSVSKCHAVTIDTEPAMPVLVNGDLVGTTPFSIKIAPSSLAVCVPRFGT